MKRKRNRLVPFIIAIIATFQRDVKYLPTKLATGLRVFSCLITNWMHFSSRFRMSLAFPIPRSFHCSSRHRKSLVLIFMMHSKFSSPEATAYFGILTCSKTRQFRLMFNDESWLEEKTEIKRVKLWYENLLHRRACHEFVFQFFFFLTIKLLLQMLMILTEFLASSSAYSTSCFFSSSLGDWLAAAGSASAISSLFVV